MQDVAGSTPEPNIWFQEKYKEFPNVFQFDELFEVSCSEEFKDCFLIKEMVSSSIGGVPFQFRLSTIDSFIATGINYGEMRVKSLHVLELKKGVWVLLIEYSEKVMIRVLYTDSNRGQWEEIRANLQKHIYVVKKKTGEINLLFQQEKGFCLKSKKIDEDFSCDIGLNYGDDFMPRYEALINSLKTEKTGLFLLSSKPGFGKTSLIKHLINTVEEHKTLFLPPHLSEAFLEPAFLPFLSEQNIDLIILEDGENVLRSREEAHGNAVSSILNMTDGILGDILKIKILATFNTAKESIDSALLRKGRLKYFHEFEPLKPEYADRLLTKLGYEPQGKTMTLAEVYNFGEETGLVKKERTRMGFAA